MLNYDEYISRSRSEKKEQLGVELKAGFTRIRQKVSKLSLELDQLLAEIAQSF